MKKKHLVVFSSILIILLLLNCRKDEYIPNVCYQETIQPILISRCAMPGCHNSVDRAGDYDVTSYNAVMEKVTPKYPSSSELYNKINDNSMPPKGYMTLTKLDKKYIRSWIAFGAINSSCFSTLPCDSLSNITYTNSIKAIFDNNCIGCHNTSRAGGGWMLDSYSAAKNCAQSGRLIGALKSLPGYFVMPPDIKLSNCDIAKIQQWIRKDMPQ